jgi:hypothetical protein
MGKIVLNKFAALVLILSVVFSQITTDAFADTVTTISGTLLPTNTFYRPETYADTCSSMREDYAAVSDAVYYAANQGDIIGTMPNPFNYFTRTLKLSASGSYTFDVTYADLQGVFDPDDTFLLLYDGDFDPNQPRNHLLVCNDDKHHCSGDLSTDQYSYIPNLPLDASHTYTLVLTSYGSGATGPVTVQVTGPSAASVLANANSSDACSISGSVGAAGAGATLTYSDGTSSLTATADGSGNYCLFVPKGTNGWSGTVTPSKEGYVFSPASMTYSNITSNQTKNYAASPATHSITAFDTLDPSIQSQMVSNGTPRASLSLPDTLTATVDNHANTQISGITWECSSYDPTAAGDYTFTAELPSGYTLEGGTSLPDITVTVKAAAPKDKLISEFAALSSSQKNRYVAYGTPELSLNLPATLTAMVDNIADSIVTVKKWVSGVTYNPNTAGMYLFHPVLDSGYALKDSNVQVPQIMVNVYSSESGSSDHKSDMPDPRPSRAPTAETKVDASSRIPPRYLHVQKASKS